MICLIPAAKGPVIGTLPDDFVGVDVGGVDPEDETGGANDNFCIPLFDMS